MVRHVAAADTTPLIPTVVTPRYALSRAASPVFIMKEVAGGSTAITRRTKAANLRLVVVVEIEIVRHLGRVAMVAHCS